MARLKPIKQISDLVVTWNRLQSKQAGRIIVPFMVLHLLLMCQKRCRLHEKY